MADRLTALAGFHDASYSVASNTTAGDALIGSGAPQGSSNGTGSAPVPALPPGMETEASISLGLPPPPRANGTAPKTSTSTSLKHTTTTSKLARPKTPPAGGSAPSQQQLPPDTAQRPDTRRRYGVTIGGLAGDPGAAGGLPISGDDDDLLLDDPSSSDVLGGVASAGPVADLQKMLARNTGRGGALGDMTNASSAVGSAVDGVGTPGGGEDSGAWGQRALGRRVAQGTNLKQLQARIDSLTAERDDLKIEVDFHRRKGSIGDIASEVITLRQEKLTYVKKVMSLNELAKKQDKALTQLKKAHKPFEGKSIEEWKRMQEELAALRKQADQQAKERSKLQEELDFLKALRDDRSRSSVRVGGSGHTSQQGNESADELQRELEDLREDHKIEIYKLETALADMEQERDELAQQLETARANGTPARTGRRSLKSAEDSDADDTLGTVATGADGAAERSIIIKRRDETIRTLEEREADIKAQLDTLRAELDAATRREEELRLTAVDVKASEEALEREVKFLKDKIQLSEQRLEEEGAETSREMVAMQNVLEERMVNEVQHWKDELTSWKLKHERQEQRVEALELEREEWEAKCSDLDFELTKIEQEHQEVVQRLEEVEKEADDLEADVQQAKQTIEQLEEEIEAQAGDLEFANSEVARLSELLIQTEQERDTHVDEIVELNAELDEAEVKMHQTERMEQALKERLNDAQMLLDEREAKLAGLSEAYEEALADKEQLGNDYHDLKEQLATLKEKLAQSQAELDQAIEDLRAEERLNRQQAEDYAAQLKEREDEYLSTIKSKDMDYAALENHADNLKEEVSNLKSDLQKLQSALRDQADQSQRLGQSHVNDRYALELEIDRLKREVASLERELEAAVRSADRKEDLLKERDAAAIKANTDLRELASKLAAEQQAHLGLSDRFEAQKKAFRQSQVEADEARAKLEELEHQRSEWDRSKGQASDQVAGQLKERNTLLLTIYQSLGRTLGADKSSSRKRDEADLKPFTNFGLFHDSLLSRMRRLGELRMHFESRAKEMEAKFTDHFSAIKKQQDGQMRTVNRLEHALKTAADKQAIWRTRIVAKQGELDAAKATNNELQQQISSLKARAALPSPATNSKFTSLNSRANNAERKLAAAQSSTQHTEDRLEEMKRQYERDESNWAARIRELELRCKAAEEKNARDRSSAKERLKALEEQKRRAEADLLRSNKQSQQLDAVLPADSGSNS